MTRAPPEGGIISHLPLLRLRRLMLLLLLQTLLFICEGRPQARVCIESSPSCLVVSTATRLLFCRQSQVTPYKFGVCLLCHLLDSIHALHARELQGLNDFDHLRFAFRMSGFMESERPENAPIMDDFSDWRSSGIRVTQRFTDRTNENPVNVEVRTKKYGRACVVVVVVGGGAARPKHLQLLCTFHTIPLHFKSNSANCGFCAGSWGRWEEGRADTALPPERTISFLYRT